MWPSTCRAARVLLPLPISLRARLSMLVLALVCSLVLVGASAGRNDTRRTSSESHVATAKELIESAIDQENRVAGQLAGAGSDTAAKDITAAADDLSHAAAEVRVAFAAEEISEHQKLQAEFDLRQAADSDYAAKRALLGNKKNAAIEDLHDAEKYKTSALAMLPEPPAKTNTPPKKPTGTYRYNVMIEARGRGDSFVVGPGYPGPQPTYSGSMSASFSMVFPVVFTVDAKAHTVDAEPPTIVYAGRMPSSSGSGTDSYTLTSMDGNQTNTCTIPAGTHFIVGGGLIDLWDTKSHLAGPMLFGLSGGFDPKQPRYPCSPSTVGAISIGPDTVPGLALNPGGSGCSAGGSPNIEIPVSDLGQQHVTTSFDRGPLACQGTYLAAIYTAHIHYTVTLNLQP
jgi:hypothetical protein